MAKTLEIVGDNRYRLLKVLNDMSDEDLGEAVDLHCNQCPFKVWCDEEREPITCQQEMKSMLRKDVKE